MPDGLPPGACARCSLGCKHEQNVPDELAENRFGRHAVGALAEVSMSNSKGESILQAPGHTRSWLVLGTMGFLILVIFKAFRPNTFDFVFSDGGANLTAYYLAAHGFRPTVDFGYHYGLLPLLFGRAWFDIVGLSPIAYRFAQIVGSTAVAIALWRTAIALKLSFIACAFLAITIGWAIGFYPNFAHMLEAVLITHALERQAVGWDRTAMTLALIASLAKPSMGYVFFGLLFLLHLRDIDYDWKRAIRALAIPISVWMGLVFWLSAVFGTRVTVGSLLPLSGMRAYRVLNYGFFGTQGRSFWHPPGVHWGYYASTIAGFWLLGTIVLVGAAGVAASALDSRRARVTFTCGVLQVTFMALFFGGGSSWFYYPYLLTLGLAAGLGSPAAEVEGWNTQAIALVVLAGISLLPWRSDIKSAIAIHRELAPHPELYGFWLYPKEALEFERAREASHGQRAVILSSLGCAPLLFEEFEKPQALYLVPGLALNVEVDRVVEQLKHADVVIVPETYFSRGVPPFEPIENELNRRFVTSQKGEFFSIYRPR